jgi:hypothetical protein
MAVVTRHGMRPPNALAVISQATGDLVPLPSRGSANAANVARHAKSPLPVGAVRSKTRTVAGQNPSSETVTRRHPSSTAFTENLKSP